MELKCRVIDSHATHLHENLKSLQAHARKKYWKFHARWTLSSAEGCWNASIIYIHKFKINGRTLTLLFHAHLTSALNMIFVSFSSSLEHIVFIIIFIISPQLSSRINFFRPSCLLRRRCHDSSLVRAQVKLPEWIRVHAMRMNDNLLNEMETINFGFSRDN